ncbi:MAG: heme ABC exporter ATP-binding protein CcmA [Myxococcales bacterium]|nr:heme ABC exporter ATP-binding protein CcmA [Myxococcales bacterium]
MSAPLFSTVNVDELVKVYDRRPVVRKVSLELKAGELTGLIGANGSGKSTLLYMISSLLPMTSGSIRYGAHTYADHPDRERLRGAIGWLAHQPFLYPELTAVENLQFFRELYGSSIDLDGVLDDVDLFEARNQRVRNYSRGMLQRLGLGRVIIKNPTLWLLDEPFTGLDRQTVERFMKMLEATASGDRLMLLVSHRMDLVARLCKRVLILSRGHLVFDGPVESEQQIQQLADERF